MPDRGRARRAARLLLLFLVAVAPLPGAALTPSPAGAQVAPEASIDDSDLGWGETTTIHGSGWGPGKTLAVVLFAGAHELARPVVAADGTFSTTIQVPSGIGSSTEYRIAVQGGAGGGSVGYVEIPLTIRGPVPTLTVSSTRLGWDDSPTVRGERWEPGTRVDISLLPVTQVLGQATVGSDGSFTVSVRIPEVASSSAYQIAATGQGIDKLFHLVPTKVAIIGRRPGISVSQTTLAWDETTRVSGELFLPGSKAQIHLLPTEVVLAEVTVGSDRRFDAEVRIPSDLASSRTYQLAVTGAGADGLFAFLVEQVTIVGPRPFMEVVDVSSGGQRAVQVTGHRFLRGTSAVVTLLPETARLGETTVAPDDTFTIRVEIPPDAVGSPDPHLVAVTGQGIDRLFALLAHEITLGTDGKVAVGGAVRPHGDRINRTGPLRSDADALLRSLGLEGVPEDDNSADELLLALLLLLLLIVGGWMLHHALRSDLRPALQRQWGHVRRLLH